MYHDAQHDQIAYLPFHSHPIDMKNQNKYVSTTTLYALGNLVRLMCRSVVSFSSLHNGYDLNVITDLPEFAVVVWPWVLHGNDFLVTCKFIMNRIEYVVLPCIDYYGNYKICMDYVVIIISVDYCPNITIWKWMLPNYKV